MKALKKPKEINQIEDAIFNLRERYEKDARFKDHLIKWGRSLSQTNCSWLSYALWGFLANKAIDNLGG